jgi:hypothetical protein
MAQHNLKNIEPDLAADRENLQDPGNPEKPMLQN